MATYPRETTEYVTYTITTNGAATTNGIQFSVVPRTTGKPRPGEWQDAEIIDGKAGFLLEPGQPGDLQIWARINDTPETPVIDCGVITRS